MTATAIVVGDADHERVQEDVLARPSASPTRSSARSAAIPHPMTPEINARTHPRRIPSSRNETTVTNTAKAIATSTTRRITPEPTSRARHDPPGQRGASAPQSVRPKSRRTFRTSSSRGWNESAVVRVEHQRRARVAARTRSA